MRKLLERTTDMTFSKKEEEEEEQEVLKSKYSRGVTDWPISHRIRQGPMLSIPIKTDTGVN